MGRDLDADQRHARIPQRKRRGGLHAGPRRRQQSRQRRLGRQGHGRGAREGLRPRREGQDHRDGESLTAVSGMARDEELCFAPAVKLAGMIARREVSPVEVVDAVIARAERLEPSLNMFAMPLYERARAQAKAAEAAITRGDALGPLHGVPITIKDNVPIAGLRMCNGSVAFADFVPQRDAVVVTRVTQAGAICIGKTNLPEFAHKVLTDSPKFGVTRSPWSLDRTPGGSSGGASAALAAGIAPIAIGTDGGGSIRCPAACTGIAGLKATLGRIPFEAMPEAFANYAFVGPMTRVVDDIPLLLSVMSGAWP